MPPDRLFGPDWPFRRAGNGGDFPPTTLPDEKKTARIAITRKVLADGRISHKELESLKGMPIFPNFDVRPFWKGRDTAALPGTLFGLLSTEFDGPRSNRTFAMGRCAFETTSPGCFPA